MANEKKYSIEIEMNDEAELGTCVLFFQKLVIVMAKFGLTYFKGATMRENYTTLMTYSTENRMFDSIKTYQEEQLKKRLAIHQKNNERETEEVN